MRGSLPLSPPEAGARTVACTLSRRSRVGEDCREESVAIGARFAYRRDDGVLRHPGRIAYYSYEFYFYQYPHAAPHAVLNDHADRVTLTNAAGDLWELLQHPEWESGHWRQLRHTEPGQSGHRRLSGPTYPRRRLASTRLAQPPGRPPRRTHGVRWAACRRP